MYFFTKSPKNLDNVLIISEKTGVVGTQGCSDGSSEGGELNKHIHIELLLGPMHAVSKHQSSLCIGVSDLDGKSLSANDDIGRPVCVFVNGVLDKSDAAGQIHGHFLLDYRLKGRKNVHGSAFVQKHVKHSSS